MFHVMNQTTRLHVSCHESDSEVTETCHESDYGKTTLKTVIAMNVKSTINTKKIIIPRCMIRDMKLLDFDFMVAVWLLNRYRSDDRIILMPGLLCADMFDSIPSRTMKTNITKSLLRLEELGLIKRKRELNRDMVSYDIRSLVSKYMKDGRYITVTFSEWYSIMTYDGFYYKGKLLRYFSYVVSCFFGSKKMNKSMKFKYCYCTISQVIDDLGSGWNRYTINEMNKHLEQIGILYVLRADNIRISSESENGGQLLRTPPNIYCRMDDKGGAITFAEEYAGWPGIEKRDGLYIDQSEYSWNEKNAEEVLNENGTDDDEYEDEDDFWD